MLAASYGCEGSSEPPLSPESSGNHQGSSAEGMGAATETPGRKQEVRESVNVIDTRTLVSPARGWWTRVDGAPGGANGRQPSESISPVPQRSRSPLMDKNDMSLCQCPEAAISNYHKAGGLKQQKCVLS